ncbi:MAG: hypothetical protein JXN59_01665 [Anaerolineae bacterium]|nr:hypothetical protein [Anaerolineae bacterium]
MELNDQFMPKVLQLYLEISQYPILSRTIRAEMRREIFARGVISEEAFEKEVYQKALQSQLREGLQDPFAEESPREWNARINTIRDHVTDFYFAYNLPHQLFEQIVESMISERAPGREVQLSFNPEIAPWDVLFAEGERYEQLPPEELAKVKHHLREIKVVLIKAMISDHLQFTRLAREAFTIGDLRRIRENRIGRGKIGGKAAGMLLAWKLIQMEADTCQMPEGIIQIPDSWYIGSDVFYELKEINDFFQFMNQKYLSKEEIIADYPEIYEHYLNAKLPAYVVEQLRDLLAEVGQTPLIFRSSSLLEDSFDTSFAGKYDSFFLPNQGTLEENLAAAVEAILRIYASTLSPDALIYREQMGLVDFDERMAILIQKVEGQQHGRYYFPAVAGVGFSRNPFRWSPRIHREDGLLRLVAGLGTRAVDRVANDYPRMIALSNPMLRPETRASQIKQYSQHLIDVIDLEDNTFKTLPITDVIDAGYPALRLIAAELRGDYIKPFIMRPTQIDPNALVFTFEQLLRQTNFARIMREMLACLQRRYKRPVDIEYAVEIQQTYPEIRFNISLLQCRPLSQHNASAAPPIPTDIPDELKLFSAHRQVPDGVVRRVKYVVLVKPAYNLIEEPHLRLEVGRAVGRLNERLKGEQYILLGPGRWGTSNIHLGVKVSYADIYNSRALIEVAVSTSSDGAPEMAYGTHFFQDLVEARIFPLAIYPDEPGTLFRWDFFMQAPNMLPALVPQDAALADYLTVIDIPAVSQGRLLELIMNTEQDEALAYLREYTEEQS